MACGYRYGTNLSSALRSSHVQIENVLVALVGCLGGFCPALAADLPFKAAPAAASSGWAGFYLGGDIGGGWGRNSSSLTDPGDAAFANCGPCFQPGFAATSGQSGSGFVGAGHLGYNWQLGSPLLLGIEGDFAYTRIQQKGNAPLTAFTSAGVPFVASGSFFSPETDDRWMASIRGRIGTTFGNWLFYGTGGVAWGEFDSQVSAGCAASNCGPIQATVNHETVRTGWVAGAGVEWQIPSTALRARLEYLYYNFDGSANASAPWTDGGLAICHSPIGGGIRCPANVTLSGINVQTVRVGMSYAFH